MTRGVGRPMPGVGRPTGELPGPTRGALGPSGSRRGRIRAVATVLLGVAALSGLHPSVATAGSVAPDTRRPGIPAPAASTGTAVTLTVRSVSPPVLGPTSTLTVAGTVQSTGVVANPSVRVVRPRGIGAGTRAEVDAWASGAATAPTLLLARRPVGASLGADAVVPFSLTMPVDGLQLTRAFGAVPIAVEVLDEAGGVLTTVRTFVGWSAPAAGATPRMSLGWVAPLTLAADPALYGTDRAAALAAWGAELGPAGRLTRLVQGTATSPVAWAVDPAVFGVPERSAEQVAADPVTPLRAGFVSALASAAAGRSVLALPYADPDLAAATDGSAVSDLVARRLTHGPDLATLLPARTLSRVAWPADGEFDDRRETAWRTAYQGSLALVLASAEATAPAGAGTPDARAVGPAGTPVLRWDDDLSRAAGDAGRALTAALSTQSFVATTAALAAERSATTRTTIAVLPRGIDADPALLAQFFATVDTLPWVSPVDVADRVAAVGAASRIEPQPDTVTHEDAVLGPGLLGSLQAQEGLLATIGQTLVDSGAFVGRWDDVVAQLTSSRWRGETVGNTALFGDLVTATGDVTQGLSITAQTTNFLADEGVLRVTVVNDLDQTVEGVQLVLAPQNARMRVVEPAEPVRIERRSKATVQVRLAAVAAGLVPVDAWLTTADGTRLGQATQLTLRANPPGVWMYVVGAAIVALVLVAGLVRGLRHPTRRPPGAEQVDVVEPTPERRLTEPVVHPSAPSPPDRRG